MKTYKKFSLILLIIIFCFSLFLLGTAVKAIGDASMTGGSFEIYADDFTGFDNAQLTGGDFTLESTGDSSGPYRTYDGDIVGTVTISEQLDIIGDGKKLYLNNGYSTTTIDFSNWAGGYTGYCNDGFPPSPQSCDGDVIVDISDTSSILLSIQHLVTAINTTTYRHNLVATHDGVDTVTIKNKQSNGVAKTITHTFVADFDTTGFTEESSTYELRGGFQAQEQGILDFSLDTNSIDLGSLSSDAVASSDIVLTVSTDSETGYTLSITEDGNFRSGANDIDDVADSAVTIGSEEYGILVVGDDKDDTWPAGDVAIGGAFTDIATHSGSVVNRDTTVTFKASVGGDTIGGNYSHDVYFTLTVNP